LRSDKMTQTTEGQLAWVLSACARVMRPLIRLALTFGVKHTHLEDLMRDLLLEEARRAWIENKGSEPNISQLSVTTGLNRKAVTAKVRQAEDPLPRTEMSAAAKTLTLWMLNAAAFVPAKDLKTMLAFLGDNTRDHLLAGVANTMGAAPPMLERSVFAAGIPLEECERIHQLVRERWSGLHHELTQEMTRAFEEAEDTASARMRVGIYTYYENGTTDYAKEPPTAPSKRSRRKA
jgi:hypothetical protein